MKRLLVAVSLALVALVAGCGRSTTAPTPIVPSPPVPAPPAPAPVPAPEQTLRGYVNDTAFRPMGGVRLEVVNGPDAGKELTSDQNGTFSYTGTFPGTVSIRATKEGYADSTSSVFANLPSNTAWVSFALAPLATPVNAEGNFTLTITVDSACPGFPDDVRTRSFAARLTKRLGTGTIPANTRFDGTVTGTQFAAHANIFWVGVAGDYLALSTEGEGPSLVEQVGPNRYIAYTGVAGASVSNPGPPTISAPFRGVIEYCEQKSMVSQYYECSDALAEAKAQCTTTNSLLTLTPR